MSQLKSQVLHFNFLRNQDFNIILSLTGIIERPFNSSWGKNNNHWHIEKSASIISAYKLMYYFLHCNELVFLDKKDTINNGHWISILENQVYIYVSFNCSLLCKLESMFFFSNGKCVNARTWFLLLLHCVEGDSHFQNKKYRFPYLTNQSNIGVPYQMEIILWFLLWNNLLPTEAQLFQPFLHSAPHPP